MGLNVAMALSYSAVLLNDGCLDTLLCDTSQLYTVQPRSICTVVVAIYIKDDYSFLPTAIARKVMQSVLSVRPFVSMLSFEPTDL